MGFKDTNGLFNLSQTTRSSVSKKKENLLNSGPCILPDHMIKLKESEKRDKFLNLSRELKKLRSIKVTMVTIEIGALSRATKGLVQGLEDLKIRGRVETKITKALLRSARILRVLKIFEDLLALRLQRKTQV